jgi:hypothetical protein
MQLFFMVYYDLTSRGGAVGERAMMLCLEIDEIVNNEPIKMSIQWGFA